MPESADRYPDITRPDAALALISTRYVGDSESQRHALDTSVAAWSAHRWPTGLLSVSLYADVVGESVLTYAQWNDEAACDAFTRARGPAVFGGLDAAIDHDRCEPVKFRRYRSTEPGDDASSPPDCIAVPSFDVDGPERQRRIVDTLLDGPLGKQLPGLIAAHFHLSTDGTRVINYAEWTAEELHIRALTGPVLQEAGAITQVMPGVRGIGCPRYRLHRTLLAPQVP
ncbi:monooxygenase [Streptomyces monticola]|uniref:Monooxygenase n=1 Tax=Streptomyces monticola TaxID=2666263 RepID=A0ABW2JVF0_9ACTN